jgi:hypothetical protein
VVTSLNKKSMRGYLKLSKRDPKGVHLVFVHIHRFDNKVVS